MERFAISGGLIAVLLWLICAVGYITNILKLYNSVDPLESGLGVLRVVGIFIPPLGTIMGLLF